MRTEPPPERRLKFYGLNDYGTYYQARQAIEVIEQYDPGVSPQCMADVLELYNAQLFIENDLVPISYRATEREAIKGRIPEIRKAVARYFNSIDDANIEDRIVDVDYSHHDDLLTLLAKFKVFQRCAAEPLLAALDETKVGLRQMLACRDLVRSYNEELRMRVVSTPMNAEHILHKNLEKGGESSIHLPSSLTPGDMRALIEAYLDEEDANPNFVKLVSLARVSAKHGIDARLKLKAKRKYDAWVEDFFKTESGIRTGCEVAISDQQDEPKECTIDGLSIKLSFSRKWLEEGLDYPTILNNFIYLFEFVDSRMILTLPSYMARLGTLERVIGITGAQDYPVGTAFRTSENLSTLCVVAYDRFLRLHGVELESVISWFFADYLNLEFGASAFKFVPSSVTASYLERCRHLFSEMESVVRQYTLYVENGELDRDLLLMSSEQVRYKEIPSLIDGKYVYPSDSSTFQRIMHLMFSDQSGLAYINETLKADDAATLISRNQITVNEFHDYQKSYLDFLTQVGILELDNGCVRFVDAGQVRFLRSLYYTEAASYFHYPTSVRAAIDQMVTAGWLVQEKTLLTRAEASYYNYCLNQSEFSNGPDLRNKYLHGSQVDASNADEHFATYVIALKLLVALVIKMNDDFWLKAET
ncbi:hypothetical protein ACFQE5_06255 [Pseudonocardia hispaniensis]|uniref:DUF4209 domain-containing protein n=1 Tax=Pseudonocardia hispaniensis TaxID=904933 RepID=A0ABW1IZ66_9PSEU